MNDRVEVTGWRLLRFFACVVVWATVVAVIVWMALAL